MLDDALKSQVSAHLTKLTRPVVLRAVLDDGDRSMRLRAFLEEVEALSDRLSLQVRSAAPGERVPVFSVDADDVQERIAFAAIPMGHEFTSFLLAVLQVGGHPLRLDDAQVARVRGLQGSLHFETYLSLSCQNCPEVVQALNILALLNPHITHVAIDGALFPEEVTERQILAVPSVYLNGQVFGQGRMGVADFLAELDTQGGAAEADALTARAPYDVLIVGGGPAGAAAAIYAARKGIRTGMVAERFGGQVLDTLSIENFVSVPATEGPKFAQALEAHVREHEVDVIQAHAVHELEAHATGGLHTVVLANGARLQARTLILATGARWRNINVPGEQEHRNRGVTYCPHCDGPLFKGKRVVVVGGGNSGVEAAIDLAGLAREVTLVEFDDKLRADAVLQRKLHSLPNAQVLTQVRTTQIQGNGERVMGLAYEDRATGETRTIETDGVFVQIGLIPNTEWLEDSGVVRTARGEIEIDERGQTSIPGVFAAGDCTTVPHKQIVVAVGAGATAALSAFDHLIRSSAPAA